MSAVSAAAPSARARFEHWLPRLVLAPSFVLSFLFIYGLIAWNGYLSVSASRMLPNYEFVGPGAVRNLWRWSAGGWR
jgi:glucose/mannose transport system permease protein